jgi:hypothetical protein
MDAAVENCFNSLKYSRSTKFFHSAFAWTKFFEFFDRPVKLLIACGWNHFRR